MFGKQFMGVLCVALLTASPRTGAQAAPPTEYEVKAAFIHNIAKFVKWPDAPHGGGKPGSSLRLCVLGQSPFAQAAGLLAGKQVDERVWEVQAVDSSLNLKGCHVLFVAVSESGNLQNVLEGIKGSAILTVGDSDGYAERGIMINFYIEQNRVRFEINMDAAQRNGLKISSQLLKLVRIVREKAL